MGVALKDIQIPGLSSRDLLMLLSAIEMATTDQDWPSKEEDRFALEDAKLKLGAMELAIDAQSDGTEAERIGAALINVLERVTLGVRPRVSIQRGENENPLSRKWYAVVEDLDDDQDIENHSQVGVGDTPIEALVALESNPQ